MGLTETQELIKGVIETGCAGWDPFMTVADIAEAADLSEQAVRNNAGAVVEQVGKIESRQVGQANVYFLKTNRMDELKDDDTVAVGQISNPETDASYYVVRESPDGSEFDLIASWYDHLAEELGGHYPSDTEIGAVARGFATDAVSIRYYQEGR